MSREFGLGRFARRWIGRILAGALFPAIAAAELLMPAAQITPTITTKDDPSLHEVSAPSVYDGVARVIINGSSSCSGSLLSGGNFLMTAAHCLTDSLGVLNVSSTSITFSGGGITTGSQYYVHPFWDGTLASGGDIGLIRLSSTSSLTGYEYWDDDSFLLVGATVEIAGYGRYGLGSEGHLGTSGGASGTLRSGQNTVDSLWSYGGNPYAYDFDDGTAARDAIQINGGISHTGLGNNEVMIAPGDSGGPMFYGGKLLGIHSFVASFGTSGGDIDAVTNSSFGELGGDTRIAAYSDWVDDVLAAPEPGPTVLVALGMAALVAGRLRRRHSS